jgi:hypothetical protein
LVRIAEGEIAQTFDLADPPLIRFVAIELPAGHCHLLMTYPKVLLDEDALFRLLCAWLGALEGALPLDVESRPGRLKSLRLRPTGGRNGLPRLPHHRHCKSIPPRAGSAGRKSNRGQFEIRPGDIRGSPEALPRTHTFDPRRVFGAVALVIGRLTDRDQILLAACHFQVRNLGWGLIENTACHHLNSNDSTVSEWLKEVAREETNVATTRP